MSAVERDDRDIGLHSVGEAADMLLKTKRASAAQGRGEEGVVRAYRGRSPRVSKGVTGVSALPYGRATAPIETRDQGRKPRFFENVAGVVAGDGIAPQSDVDAVREELLKRRPAMTELGIRFGAVRDAGAVLFDEREI